MFNGLRGMVKDALNDDGDYVKFGDVARSQCGEQAQYVSRCIDGVHGYPNLGEGLRFRGDPRSYHEVLIHKGDVGEFVQRYSEFRKARRF